jgi:DMSO/TMAO reductase YedYZ molybdopterin-dependent catalytic subunit
MKPITRRRFLTTGIITVAGASGLYGAERIANRYGLIPPDAATWYGPGETLDYDVQRIFGRNALAREFSPSQITHPPFRNELGPPLPAAYRESERNGFRDWRLKIDGLVENPTSFSLAEIHSMPARSQITMLSCEEGWSYIGEWIGVPLSHLLDLVGAKPNATYVVYRSIQPDYWWDSLDIFEARHPQTLMAYAMNGSDLTHRMGAPLRMRVPRQLGYKSIKFVNHITVTDNIKSFENGLGSGPPSDGYSWFAGE